MTMFLPPMRITRRAAVFTRFMALLLALSSCEDAEPTAPVPALAVRYRLVAVGASIVPTVLDTTFQGERLLTSGTLEFIGATVGSARPGAANREFSFQSSEEENGVPRWVESMQMLSGVRQSGRYVIFSLPSPDGEPQTILDSAIVADDGSLTLRAALAGFEPTARRYTLLFEPEPASEAMRR
jgi:hypothetical protein